MIYRTVIALILSIVLITPPANASLLGWLGIREAGENAGKRVATAIDDAVRSLGYLQGEFDTDVGKYLDRVDEISAARLSEALDGSRSLADAAQQAIQEIREIKNEAFYDARQVIWDIECLGTVYSQDLKNTLGDLISIISDTEAEVKMPFGVTGQLNIKKVNISAPNIAYEEIKNAYLSSLNDATKNTHVLTVLSAYGNISRLARKTSCHYRGISLGKYFLAEFAYYESQASPWAEVTGLNKF